MTAYRLDTAGLLIDRERPVAFRFDGRNYTGFAGDSLASALLANDVRHIAASFKYHRHPARRRPARAQVQGAGGRTL